MLVQVSGSQQMEQRPQGRIVSATAGLDQGAVPQTALKGHLMDSGALLALVPVKPVQCCIRPGWLVSCDYVL